MSNGAAMVVQSAGPGLAKASVDSTRAFEPRDVPEAYKMAELLVASGLLPRGVQRPESAFAIIATGRELGLTAMQSLRSIHIIEGKPTLSADLIAALCKSRPDVCAFFRLVESTDKIATYETQRRGEPSPTRMSWTWEDATRAGVTSKDNWRKYPAAMLRARAITALARAVYPDLAMGIYDPDEVYDDAPTPAPAPMRVVDAPRAAAPAPAPAAAPKPSALYEMLCKDIDAAETKARLNKVASTAKRGKEDGTISAEEYSALARATKAKGTLLAERPSEPAQPKVEYDRDALAALDEQDRLEAEADAMAGEHDR